jgi:hypothetical protein
VYNDKLFGIAFSYNFNGGTIMVKKEILNIVLLIFFSLLLSVIGRFLFGTIIQHKSSLTMLFVCYPGTVMVSRYYLAKCIFKDNIHRRRKSFLLLDKYVYIECMIIGLIYCIGFV